MHMTQRQLGYIMRGMKKISGLFFLLFLVFCNTAFAECIQGNCINGQGTYTWASGDKYVGKWKEDRKHGQGTFTKPDGKTVQSIFEDGELIEEQ